MKKVSMDELFYVLSFYAEKDNYFWTNEYGQDISEIEQDGGLKARKLLKKLVKENLNAAGIKFTEVKSKKERYYHYGIFCDGKQVGCTQAMSIIDAKDNLEDMDDYVKLLPVNKCNTCKENK